MFLVSIIVIYSLISLIWDIIEIVRSIVTQEYKKAKDLNGWKDMIVKLYFYRICTSTMYVLVLLSILIYQTSIKSGNAHPILSSEMQFLSVCRILIPLCACWSIMYFMQVNYENISFIFLTCQATSPKHLYLNVTPPRRQHDYM